MKQHYSTVCKKILEHYQKMLTDKEILALQRLIKLDNYDNLNIIIFINKIINRIWQQTLTKLEFYKEGEPFKFLTTRDYNPSTISNENLDKFYQFSKGQSYTIKLITNENIDQITCGSSGLLVEIDYINSFSQPLLPIDFEGGKKIEINGKINVIGVYNTSLKLENYDPVEEDVRDFAKTTYLQHIPINKPLYNFLKKQKLLNTFDKHHLIDSILTYYLVEYDILDTNLKNRILYPKYKDIILKKYTEYFNKLISLEEFITNIFQILDNDPNMQPIIAQFDKKL